jgi:hypothetical protein
MVGEFIGICPFLALFWEMGLMSGLDSVFTIKGCIKLRNCQCLWYQIGKFLLRSLYELTN